MTKTQVGEERVYLTYIPRLLEEVNTGTQAELELGDRS